MGQHVYAALLVWVQAHGMAGVFLFMAIENMAIPFPTELGFITAQGLVSGRWCPYWYAFSIITLGQMAGSAVTYYAGRAGHGIVVQRFGHSKMTMRVQEKMHGWYAKYGALAILFGRLVGQVRPWASLAAGMAKVPQGRFWFWTTIGASIYTVIAMALTKVGWEWAVRYPQWRAPAIIVVLIIFYGVAGTGVTMKWWQRRCRRKQAAAEKKAGADAATDGES